MNKMTITITFYNKTDKEINIKDVYQKAKEFLDFTGYPYNYFGLMTKTRSYGKIFTVNRSEKKIYSETDENIKSIGLLSLPKGFKQAAFDYDVSIYISQNVITATLNESDYNEAVYSEFLCCFNDIYPEYETEIFKMSRSEAPFFYVMRDNSPEFYKTLEIIYSNH